MNKQSSQMRVCYIITGLSTGGAEMMLYKLLSSMEQRNSRVISLIGGGPMSERIKSIGVAVDTLKMRRGVPSFSALRHLREIVRRERPDLIQGWMYHGNLLATVADCFCESRTPVVWNVRQSLYDLNHESLLTRWVIRANRLLSEKASAIIYNSRTSARQHEAFGFNASRTRVIPNGFNTDVFCPDDDARVAIRRELGLSTHEILIGLIGRYHPMKDHRNFLNAAALLNKKFPNVYFLLAGHEVDVVNPDLSALILELGLADRMFLLGERKDIPQLTAALDVASSSSWAEAFPNVIGEAMSCCVPCVVTDVGDSAWIIGDTGRVVPPRDPAALAKAWQELIEMGEKGRHELGMKARQRVIDNFSIDSVLRQYESLYEKVVSLRDKEK